MSRLLKTEVFVPLWWQFDTVFLNDGRVLLSVDLDVNLLIVFEVHCYITPVLEKCQNYTILSPDSYKHSVE